MRDLKRVVVLLATTGCLAATAAQADWLVTLAGERIETRGGWEIRGRTVVFTRPNGALSSLRLSEVDIAASDAATREASAPAAAPVRDPALRPQAVRVITTEDVGEGRVGAQGTDLLIERLREAHRFKDVGLVLGLIHWEGVPDSMRGDIESQFEWMMEQRIRNIRFVPADPEQTNFEQVQDEVAYEPNVEVAGKIEIEFVPDPDEAEVLLTFPIGSRLGSFFIAAPREVED